MTAPFEYILLALLTLVASLVGTTTGFGVSTIMIPVLLFFFAPLETLLFVGVVHLFGDFWKVLLFRRGAELKLTLLIGLPSIVFSLLGSQLLLAAPSELITRLVGGFLALYALALAVHSRLKIPATTASAVTGGAISGFMAGVSGIGGAIRAAFLTAFRLPVAKHLFVAGAVGVLADTTRLINYAVNGVSLGEQLLIGLAICIPVSLLGAEIAKTWLKKTSEKQFRLIILLFLLIIGLKFVLWP